MKLPICNIYKHELFHMKLVHVITLGIVFFIWYGFGISIVTYMYVLGFCDACILLQGIAYSDDFQL